VNFKPSHRYIERELEFSAKSKASTPLHQITILRRRFASLSNFGIIFTHLFMTKGGESSSTGLYFTQKYPFLAIHAKGGESISPKQKDRTTTLILKRVFQIGILFVFKKGERVPPSKIDILKPS
jgi:hypothetical protein